MGIRVPLLQSKSELPCLVIIHTSFQTPTPRRKPQSKTPDPSLRLEKKNGTMAQVEVDEMLSFMCDERSEVATNDAVPGWSFALVKLGHVSIWFPISGCGTVSYCLLNVHCNVLLDAVLGHSLLRYENY